MSNQELAGILQQQNALLHRVETILTENQDLKAELEEISEREARFPANCGKCTRSFFRNFCQNRRNTLHQPYLRKSLGS